MSDAIDALIMVGNAAAAFGAVGIFLNIVILVSTILPYRIMARYWPDKLHGSEIESYFKITQSVYSNIWIAKVTLASRWL